MTTPQVPGTQVFDDHDVRLQQAKDALEHAKRFPHGNAGSSHQPERDALGRLTRKGIEQCLAGGGSVSVNVGGGMAAIVTSPDQIDAAVAQLVAGDDKAVADTLTGIEERQAALDRERQGLLARHGAAKKRQEAAEAAGTPTGGDGLAQGADAKAGSEAAQRLSRTHPQLEQPGGGHSPHQGSQPHRGDNTATGTANVSQPGSGVQLPTVPAGTPQGGGLTVRTPEESHARAVQRAEEVAGGKGTSEGEDEDDDPEIAGRKLSEYEEILDKKKPQSEAEAKQILDELDGVGAPTAEKIVEALKVRDTQRERRAASGKGAGKK